MWFLFVSFWEREFKQLARIEIHGKFGSETEREDGIQQKTDVVLLIYIIKKQPGLNWVNSGRPSGSIGFCRVKSQAEVFFNPARF